MDKKATEPLVDGDQILAAAASQPICPIMADWCLKDKCAWWNYQVEACAVAVLAMETGTEIAKRERAWR